MGWVSPLGCCSLVQWVAILPPTCLASGAAALTQHLYKPTSQSLSREGSIAQSDTLLSKAPQRKEWFTHHWLKNVHLLTPVRIQSARLSPTESNTICAHKHHALSHSQCRAHGSSLILSLNPQDWGISRASMDSLLNIFRIFSRKPAWCWPISGSQPYLNIEHIAKNDISINIFQKNTNLRNCSLDFKYCFLRVGLKRKWLTSHFVHLVTQGPLKALNYKMSLRIWCKDETRTSQGSSLLPFSGLSLTVPPFLSALWDHKWRHCQLMFFSLMHFLF